MDVEKQIELNREIHKEMSDLFFKLKLSYKFTSALMFKETRSPFVRFLFSKPTKERPVPEVVVAADVRPLGLSEGIHKYSILVEGQRYSRVISIDSNNIRGDELNEALLNKVYDQKHSGTVFKTPKGIKGTIHLEMQVTSFAKGFEFDNLEPPAPIRPVDHHQIPSAPQQPRKAQVQTRPHVQQDEKDKDKDKDKEKEPRSVLDSRLRRQEVQCYSPATASIVSAAQGLDEDSLMIIADLITFVCRAQGGRAGRQRRCAVADTPKTVDHIANWLSHQNELLGNDLLTGLSGLMAPQQHIRRSSSCPPEKSHPFEGMLLKGDRVVALKDIKSKKAVVVTQGTHGTVNSSCDNKVNVTFDQRIDGMKKSINVKHDVITKVTPEEDAAYLNEEKAKMLAEYDNDRAAAMMDN